MTKFNSLLIAMVGAIQFSGISVDQRPKAVEKSIPLSDSTLTEKLTIVRIKTPWYAWRGLVVSKMKKSIPQYQNIDGLQYKYFSVGQNNKIVGGIYFWKKESDARKWFTDIWFKRTKKKYGEKGKVQYFNIQKITAYKNSNVETGNSWAVLSYTNGPEFEVKLPVNGLINFVVLTDDVNTLCYLTLWQNRKCAETFFATRSFTNEYFDTPVLVNNSK